MDLYTFNERVNGIFYEATEELVIPAWLDRLSRKETSDAEEEVYISGRDGAELIEWLDGPRRVRTSTGDKFTVPNIDYQDAIEIRAKDLRHDRFRDFDRQLEDMSRTAHLHPIIKSSEVINAMPSTLCRDGQFFFDTDHLTGKSGVQSNILATTVVDASDPTPQELAAKIWLAIIRQRSFKNANGRPFARGPAHYIVMVPTNLMDKASSALNATFHVVGSTAVDNSLHHQKTFSIELVENPDMIDTWGTGDFSFAVFREDGPGSVFLKQDEVPVYLDDTAVNAYELFHRKRVIYGVQRTYNLVGWSWHKAVLVNLSDA